MHATGVMTRPTWRAAGFALAVVLTGCGADTGPAAVPTPDASLQSTAASAQPPGESADAPAPSATEGPLTWQKVLDVGETGRVNSISDVAQLGDRLIAVGTSVHATIIHVGPYESDGLIRVSDDSGSTWRDVATPDVFLGAGLRRIVVVDGEAFVFGGMTSPESQGGFVWRSTDGDSWELGELPGFAGEGWWVTADIAGGPLGWVMIGQRISSEPPHTSEQQVWFTPDWENWELTRSAPGPASETGPNGEESYYDVAVGPEGFVVAAQLLLVGELPVRVLASSDGRDWHESPEQPALPRGTSMSAVAPLGGDWVGAGTISPGDGSPVWKSGNGLDWSQVALLADPQGREGFGWGRFLVSLEDRLFLSTQLRSLTAELEAGVWSSVDGVEWSLLDLDAGASVSSGLWLGDRWLLAGHADTIESNAVIWIGSGG